MTRPAGAGRTRSPLCPPADLWHAPRADTLLDIIAGPAREFAALPAAHLSLDGRTAGAITWGGLWSAACATGSGLEREGVAAGEPVLLVAPTSPAFLSGFFGILAAGGVPVPVAPPASVRADRLDWYRDLVCGIAADSGARIVLTTARYAAALRSCVEAMTPRPAVIDAEAPAAPGRPEARGAAPAQLALLQYTSGSTSRPKGVALTHANVIANMAGIAGAICRDHSVGISWLPLHHDMGLIGALLTALYSRVPILLMPPAVFIKEPAAWLRGISTFGATIALAPNFAFGHVVRHAPLDALQGCSLASLETVLNGAEPVDPAAIAAFQETFAPLGLPRGIVRPVYGLAESALAVTFSDPGDPVVDEVDADRLEGTGHAVPSSHAARSRRFVSVGRPLPTQDVRIVDPDGRECPERVVGEIAVRGPSVMQGYYGREAETRAALRGGWLHTGDAGYLADGRLYLTSRIKDLIIRRGRNYYPADIERLVGDTEGILRGGVVAFGAGDTQDRVVVVAETRLRDPQALDALARAIRERCHGAFLFGPDDVQFVRPGGIPRTTSGKVRRGDCRRFYLDGALPGSPHRGAGTPPAA